MSDAAKMAQDVLKKIVGNHIRSEMIRRFNDPRS